MNAKSIVISGASRGIGRSLALQLAKAGHRLVLMARTAQELLEVQAACVRLGAECEIVQGSVSEEAVCDAAVQVALQKFGSIHAVVNNAGYGLMKNAELIEPHEWDELYATNVKGTFLLTRAAIPHFKEQMHGHVVVVASDVAKRTFATGSLYSSSKYAQHAFADAIRKELRPFNIKVSTVYSGVVDSHFHAEPEGDNSHSWWLKNEDVATAIEFILNQPDHVVIDELMIHPLQQDYP